MLDQSIFVLRSLIFYHNADYIYLSLTNARSLKAHIL